MVLRWGILASGSIARVFASDLAILDPERTTHRITCIGSREPVRAAQFASEFQIPAFGTYSEVLSSDDVDVVYIANVQSAHYATALSALEAGKHVLCEKPFTLNSREAETIFTIARQKQLFVMEAMWTRFLPHTISILDLVSGGAIGEPRFLLADHGQWVYRKENHRLLDPAKGGGALLDLGVYPITLAHLIFGMPTSIDAQGHFTASGVDSDVSMIFSYLEGGSALLHTTLESVTPTRAAIIGSKARIEIDRSFYAPAGFTLIKNDGSQERFESGLQMPGYVGLGEQLKEVARAIARNEIESPMRPHQATLEVMRILDRVRDLIGLRYPSEISDSHDSGIVS